ncbi:MAG TPA: hypothetical protein VK402_11675 [Blastococcus sp.]|nr:hypothetical protein [Blastococcus sp.]
MTQPDAVEERGDAASVGEGQDGEVLSTGPDGAAGEPAGGDIAAPQLAAIQKSYEEARASIARLAGVVEPAAQDASAPHPETEKIELSLAKPPVVEETATPPTAAMSVAAKYLAERPVIDEMRSQTDAKKPSTEQDAASSTQDEVPAPARRWWRALRTALPGVVPAPR